MMNKNGKNKKKEKKKTIQNEKYSQPADHKRKAKREILTGK